MLKNVKRLFIIAVILILSFTMSTVVFAADTSEDVEGNVTSSRNTTSDESDFTENTIDDESMSEDENENIVDDSESEINMEDEEESFENYTGTPDTTSTTVSSVNNASDSEFGLPELLNVVIIVIGILTLLLGIAILVKNRR